MVLPTVDQIMATFDELDEEGTEFVPRLDLRKGLDEIAEHDFPLVAELSALVKGLDTMILEKDDFKDMVEEWLPEAATRDHEDEHHAWGVEIEVKAPNTRKSAGMSLEELMEAFDYCDEDETGFAPRLDLRVKLEELAAANGKPQLQSLADAIRELDTMILDRDDFEAMVAEWQEGSGSAEVEVEVEVKVKAPSVEVEVEVEVKAPSVEVEVEVELKAPSVEVQVEVELKAPSVEVKVKAPSVEVEVEVEVKAPCVDLGVSSLGFEVEVKAPAIEVEVKAPSVEVFVGKGGKGSAFAIPPKPKIDLCKLEDDMRGSMEETLLARIEAAVAHATAEMAATAEAHRAAAVAEAVCGANEACNVRCAREVADALRNIPEEPEQAPVKVPIPAAAIFDAHVDKLVGRAHKKFDQLDKDSNGCLEGAELTALGNWVYSSFHPGSELCLAEQEAEGMKILGRLDENDDGAMSFEEFEGWFRKTCVSIEKYRRGLAQRPNNKCTMAKTHPEPEPQPEEECQPEQKSWQVKSAAELIQCGRTAGEPHVNPYYTGDYPMVARVSQSPPPAYGYYGHVAPHLSPRLLEPVPPPPSMVSHSFVPPMGVRSMVASHYGHFVHSGTTEEMLAQGVGSPAERIRGHK